MITVLTTLGWVFILATWACWLASFIVRRQGRDEAADHLWDVADWPLAGVCACRVIVNALQGDWPWVAIFAAALAWLLWRRWRKHRKRAAALLGAKSRAIRDALVRKQREARTPRPVLRPQPQGGGW